MLPSICRHIRHAHLNCPQFNPVIPEAEKRNLSKRYGFCKTSSLLNSKLSNFGGDGIDWYWKKCVYFSRCSLGLRRMWTWTLICWKAWNALSSETESRSQAEVVCHCCLMVPGWGWGDLFFVILQPWHAVALLLEDTNSTCPAASHSSSRLWAMLV